MFYKFDSESKHRRFTVSGSGCYLRALLVGAGGHTWCNAGAGSGYVSYKSGYRIHSNVEYQVTVGKGGSSATASAIDAMFRTIIMADAGQDSQKGSGDNCKGGDGFSGGKLQFLPFSCLVRCGWALKKYH